jgi:Uri superfamily endonuclease
MQECRIYRDYTCREDFLSKRNARIERVILASTDPDDECRVNCAAAESRVAVPGFGASDCRNSCPGHLWKVED